MAEAAALVIVGDVVEVTSLGRPDLPEDPDAGEYVAVTVRAIETLAGQPADDVVLAWHAYDVDDDGRRIATLITNGVRPPAVADRLLLFLVPVDPAFDEHVGGAPTHQLVKLDGIAYLDGEALVAAETNSPAAEQLVTMDLSAIRDEIAG
jgi:hypothetical protein